MLNRALNSMKTLVSVCGNSEDGAAAMVLNRVIVEIWIVVRWITNRDSDDRARKFTQFEAKGIERAIEVFRSHDPNLLIPENPNQEILTKAASLYSSHVHWAGSVRFMAEEQEMRDPSLTDLKYFYKVPYFISSWFVHSHVMGVRSLYPDPGAIFRFKDDSSISYCEMALAMATNSLVLTAMRVSDVLGLGISDQLRDVWSSNIEPLLQP